VWITTDDNNETKNIGQLNIKNGSKAVLKQVLYSKDIYITASISEAFLIQHI
jgi:hypothetical protein